MLAFMERSEEVKSIRRKLGLTQTRLAELLGVSFATVNRWENKKFDVPDNVWEALRIADKTGVLSVVDPEAELDSKEQRPLDFQGRANAVRTLVEGERLSFGHLANPLFGTEVSLIDPLPHQRIAVYDHMLKQDRLRFLLADDAGAGKTIMSGLYIREMLSRRLIRRVLIVPPAGLLGNWQREMASLFNLEFDVAVGSQFKSSNPFVDSDRLIVSVDTLRQASVFKALADPKVEPYDLVIFDEAHKLAADKEADILLKRTGRYRLAEAIVGIDAGPEWRLPWSARHLLLLTATPHMGKDYPYYCLWRLLDPNAFSTQQAFDRASKNERQRHFIRRTKEEMVDFAGHRIYPTRVANTFSYSLAAGPNSEQDLYDQTTDYLENFYNQSDLLNSTTAQLAMSVFQRRLASSTYALLCSFRRRLQKLDDLIVKAETGVPLAQSSLSLNNEIDIDTYSADEEGEDGHDSEAEMRESEAEVFARSLSDLKAERVVVSNLVDLADRVYQQGDGSKFQKLMDLLDGGPVNTGDIEVDFGREKVLIFTEHRDTLDFIVSRLGQHGFAGRVGFLHGGMDYKERERVVAEFKKEIKDGGLQYLVATDAAGEGVNLQFCWVMVNWDVPWNPARLEQRMGRIHRYGQKHDPVYVLNLIAANTREGRVMATLLDKLELIRKQIGSDKVYDVVGRLFQGVSLRDYMRIALTDENKAARDLGGLLTKEQVDALDAQEAALYGAGGEVARELPRLRQERQTEIHRQLLPGYVQKFVENVADEIQIEVQLLEEQLYRLWPRHVDAMTPLVPVLTRHYSSQPLVAPRVAFSRLPAREDHIFVHPGEPLHERFRAMADNRFKNDAQRGAVFLDPKADRPSLYALVRLDVVRGAHEEVPEFNRCAILASHLVGIEATARDEVAVVPLERLILLADGAKVPPGAVGFLAETPQLSQALVAYANDVLGSDLVLAERRRIEADTPSRRQRLVAAFDTEYVELTELRSKLRGADPNNIRAQIQLDEIKRRQRDFDDRKEAVLHSLDIEPLLVRSDQPEVIAWAMIVPTQSQEAQRQIDARIEETAIKLAIAFEQNNGASVCDVSTPAGALAAGLREFPGFDLLSRYPDGSERYVEVKGRAGSGEIMVSDNEWSAACNYRERYWLYTVFDCDKLRPSLRTIQDPFGSLLVRGTGVSITKKEIEKVSYVG